MRRFWPDPVPSAGSRDRLRRLVRERRDHLIEYVGGNPPGVDDPAGRPDATKASRGAGDSASACGGCVARDGNGDRAAALFEERDVEQPSEYENCRAGSVPGARRTAGVSGQCGRQVSPGRRSPPRPADRTRPRRAIAECRGIRVSISRSVTRRPDSDLPPAGQCRCSSSPVACRSRSVRERLSPRSASISTAARPCSVQHLKNQLYVPSQREWSPVDHRGMGLVARGRTPWPRAAIRPR